MTSCKMEFVIAAAVEAAEEAEQEQRCGSDAEDGGGQEEWNMISRGL